jgi:thymidylate synthase (FAD)
MIETTALSEVLLLDHMGDDYAVIDAARISTGKSGQRKGEELDKKLLRYLYTAKHTGPFEHVIFKFYIKTPIFVARQIMRHRTGKWNEASARYKEMPTIFFAPEFWRAQNLEGNKQGSNGLIDEQDEATELMMHAYEVCVDSYHRLLGFGTAKEQARIVLPVGLMTELFMTLDLHNLLHFLRLRMDSHAQPETQEVGRQILKLITPLVPWTMELFQESLKTE